MTTLSATETPLITHTESPEEEPEKKDWLKITAIALLVLAGVVLAFAFFCTNGTFPKELLGGKIGLAATYTAGLCVLSVGGALFLYHWIKKKDAEEAPPLETPT